MLARKKLNIEEVFEMRNLPHVVGADGALQHVGQFRVGQVSVKYEGHKVASTILTGATAAVNVVSNLTLLEGRMWTDDEDKRGSHICVLGYDTWQELFGDQPAIGKEVNVESSMYTVVGVLDKQKQPFGGGKNRNDNQVYFPLGTFHNLHPEDKDMWVSVKYDDAKNKALVQEEIRELLRIRRHVRVEAPDDFEIFGPDSLSKLWGQLTGGLVLFMIAVSSVGLMVGGVGVMNIMLVSVTERTREIGVRKAIGATKRTLLTQFTTEAVTLCAVGGIVGIVLGAILTWIIYFLPIGLPATVSSVWVITGFCVSCGIGLVFGIYPAWKAANLDPIEALRYE
jgi:putative ABC transport system permease protein